MGWRNVRDESNGMQYDCMNHLIILMERYFKLAGSDKKLENSFIMNPFQPKAKQGGHLNEVYDR
jgi:hypothetical protein